MKTLRRKIDRFCMNRPRFGIPRLMRYIVFGTGLVFFLSMMDTTHSLAALLSFSPEYILRGEVWRLVSFIFVPQGGHIFFFAIMLYVYYMLGTALEREWGTAKFTLFYFSSVLMLIIGGFAAYFLLGGVHFPFVQAHYIHLMLFFAFATFYPDMIFRIFFIIPIPAKLLGILSALVLLYDIFLLRTLFPANLVPLLLLLPYLIFCGDELLGYLRRRPGRKPPFMKSAQQRNWQQQNRPKQSGTSKPSYMRKCEVCGKTDTAHPNLEFRYCSQCTGFHCYCMDHINDHPHVR